MLAESDLNQTVQQIFTQTHLFNNVICYRLFAMQAA